jgi:hypothetical protein
MPSTLGAGIGIQRPVSLLSNQKWLSQAAIRMYWWWSPPTILVSTIRPQEADCTGLPSGESLSPKTNGRNSKIVAGINEISALSAAAAMPDFQEPTHVGCECSIEAFR